MNRYDMFAECGHNGSGFVEVSEYSDGEWVRYTDVAPLVEALRNLVPWCVTDVLEHCDGNKCREMWCAGCFGEDQAEANVAKARNALKAARAALSNLDSQERGVPTGGGSRNSDPCLGCGARGCDGNCMDEGSL